MRSTFGGLSTAFTALQANQKRLDLVGQNLANMNTPGYTRQQLDTSSLQYSSPMAHFMNGTESMVGFGVRMNGVSQIRDPFLDAQYRTQMTKSSYTDSLQSSLDSLSKILDESDKAGIRQAFDDIQSTLAQMQDPSKVVDSVYESELRARMQALTNLLNDASSKIEDAQNHELQKLDGTGTSEQGAVQKVNDILSQIGSLNRQIKDNQILGQPSLELMDKRNLLLDELSSYVPIEITYTKDAARSSDKDWPLDLKVEMVYTDTDGSNKRLTLVDGTNGKGDENYGKLSVTPGSSTPPSSTSISFEKAASSTGANDVTVSANGAQLSSGSIQASLDMLGKDGSLTATGTALADFNDVKGYQYYTQRLDELAAEFAKAINGCNGTAGDLLTNKVDGTQPVTAATIGISKGWINGSIHISKEGDNSADAVLDMLQAMKDPRATLGNKSFADFMNNVSTGLANESSKNINALKTNVTVLNGIQGSRDSVSGISMDEEATNMMAYLSAYNAASRLMTAMDEALETLIKGTGLVGR